jgi:TPR repeat protein
MGIRNLLDSLQSGSLVSGLSGGRQLAKRNLLAVGVGLFLAIGIPADAAAQSLHSPSPDQPLPGAEDTGIRVRPGNLQDELRVAGDYLIGRGVRKDPAQAAYWYRKAGDQGDPDAQNQLGYLYSWGIGVDQDSAQALKWFARAAGSGSQTAKLNLAVMYLRGQGTAANPRMAVSLFTELAVRGDTRAQAYLGLLYYSGVAVLQNRQTAEQWFLRSAKGKNPEGEFALGTLYFSSPDHVHDLTRAAGYLRQAARNGYVPAMHTLGILLIDHPEIRQKGRNEALSMLMRAAEAGTWRASAALGFLARDRRGSDQDTGEAFRWLTVAAQQGGPEAEQFVHADMLRCSQFLTAAQQEDQKRRALAWAAQHAHPSLYIFADSPHLRFPMEEVYAPGVPAQP